VRRNEGKEQTEKGVEVWGSEEDLKYVGIVCVSYILSTPSIMQQ
jgi:hypothetical protein